MGRGSHHRTDEVVTVACPLCGSRSVDEVWRHSSGIANGVCKRCGHVYLFRRLTNEAIAASYEDYAQQYPESFLLDERNPLFEVARRRVAFLKSHLPDFPPAAVLEVGCGYGHFLSLMQDVADCHGVEPSHGQAEFARSELGVAGIIQGDFESADVQARLAQRKFDLACSFHVLEHLVSPVRFMELVSEHIGTDGHLCVAVPDLATLSPDLIELYFMSRSWHLHSFSRDTMTMLLRSQGFGIVAAESEGATPMLRSSTVFLARYEGLAAKRALNAGPVAESRVAAMRFHSELERRLKRIRQAFVDWGRDGRRVAVYGGGIHTRALLSLTGVTPEEVVAIIDDDPAKEGTVLFDAPVLSLQKALSEGIDVIVVSSLASEDDIVARLVEDGIAERVAVKGIYRDLCR